MADVLRVALVDDSKLVLSQLGVIVDGAEGVELAGTARDGAQAIRLAAHEKPDLVLMDIVMPGMDGLSALRMIRATLPDVRVAMISSLGGSGRHAEEAFRLGAVQVIAKPFDAEQLEGLFETERELLGKNEAARS